MALALSALLRLVLPVECPGCGRPDVVICPECADVLGGSAVRAAVPAGWARDGPPIWTCARYEGPVSRTVVAWKDRGRLDLTRVLAEPARRALVAALGELDVGGPGVPGGRVLVVPVPSSPQAVRARGEDVVGELARRAVADDRLTVLRVVAALRQIRRPQDQSGLGADERWRNVAGAYAVHPRRVGQVSGRRCIVLDDVLTTGASAAEAVRALGSAGAQVVAVATVCATPRRRPSATPPARSLSALVEGD